MTLWDHILKAIEAAKHTAIVVAVIVVAIVVWRVGASIEHQITAERAVAQAADSTKTPAQSLVSTPRTPDVKVVGIPVSSGRAWTTQELSAAVAAEVRRIHDLDAAAGKPERPPSTTVREAEQHLYVPEYIPPTPADAARKEQQFSIHLADTRLLATFDISADDSWGGSGAVVQSRDGGPAAVKWRPNERPAVSFRQLVEFGVGPGVYGEVNTAGVKQYEFGAHVFVAWYPARYRDWHLKIEPAADFLNGRVPWQITATGTRWFGRPD